MAVAVQLLNIFDFLWIDSLLLQFQQALVMGILFKLKATIAFAPRCIVLLNHFIDIFDFIVSRYISQIILKVLVTIPTTIEQQAELIINRQQ
jgi:hypothetical protein